MSIPATTPRPLDDDAIEVWATLLIDLHDRSRAAEQDSEREPDDAEWALIVAQYPEYAEGTP